MFEGQTGGGCVVVNRLVDGGGRAQILKSDLGFVHFLAHISSESSFWLYFSHIKMSITEIVMIALDIKTDSYHNNKSSLLLSWGEVQKHESSLVCSLDNRISSKGRGSHNVCRKSFTTKKRKHTWSKWRPVLSPFLPISFCWSHLSEYWPFIFLTEKLVPESVHFFFHFVFLKVIVIVWCMKCGPEITWKLFSMKIVDVVNPSFLKAPALCSLFTGWLKFRSGLI